MKKVITFLSSLYLLTSTTFAQEDTWDAYLAQYEKGIGSTLINMSAKAYAPDIHFPFIVITGVKFKGCSTDGMPSTEQFPELYAITDSANLAISLTTTTIHVGTFTYQCERLDYFYVKDTIGLRSAISAVYSRAFTAYQPYLNIKTDKKWEAYLDFLYPNEEVFEFMQNQKVLFNLEEKGDKLDKARQVDHWAYFTTEKDRDCFIPYLTKAGFKIETKEKTKDKPKPYQLRFSRTDKILLTEISKLTLVLKKEAEKCNGDYDGWETFVIK